MNEQLLNIIESMSKQELYNEVYLDHLTKLLNRKAFDIDNKPFFAIVDLDSLKFVNDTLGHRYGDGQLCGLAASLTEVFGDDSVYRLSGDEFAVKGHDKAALAKGLAKLEMRLPCFSYGIGDSLELADAQLNSNKASRERQGLRVGRGMRPPWIANIKEFIA